MKSTLIKIHFFFCPQNQLKFKNMSTHPFPVQATRGKIWEVAPGPVDRCGQEGSLIPHDRTDDQPASEWEERDLKTKTKKLCNSQRSTAQQQLPN